STSGNERERRGGCWLCRVSLATLSHSPRFPSPSPRNLSSPFTADPAEGRGTTGCRQLTPATPTAPSPTAETAEGGRGDAWPPRAPKQAAEGATPGPSPQVAPPVACRGKNEERQM
ncbi:unnamed protein product, partial [Closterium sp. NIES-54]